MSDLCREEWQVFGRDVTAAERASMMAEKGFAFAFVEGALVKAVREGWWLLLDEINLAPAEVSSLQTQSTGIDFSLAG